MKSAEDHPLEQQRLTTLENYQVMDSAQERNFDELTELASTICGASISLISLVDGNRQWFKSRVGLDASETPKSIAFCSHAILQDEVFEIPDALADKRFVDNPLVTGSPDIRFYAGAPLVAPDGSPIGTLCVIDREPKKLTEGQTRALQILSHQVVGQLELRKQKLELEQNYHQQQNMLASIAHDLRSPFSSILGLSGQLSKKAEHMSHERIVRFSHNILNASLQVYQLLDEMLQWSTQNVRASKVNIEPELLLPLVSASFELLEEALKLKDIRYQCHVAPGVTLMADSTLLKSVVRNLLNNAIKFTPDGGRIDITTSEDANMLRVHVINTGEHIAEELQHTLFTHATKSTLGTSGEVQAWAWRCAKISYPQCMGIFATKLQIPALRLFSAYPKLNDHVVAPD